MTARASFQNRAPYEGKTAGSEIRVEQDRDHRDKEGEGTGKCGGRHRQAPPKANHHMC